MKAEKHTIPSSSHGPSEGERRGGDGRGEQRKAHSCQGGVQEAGALLPPFTCSWPTMRHREGGSAQPCFPGRLEKLQF